MAFEKKVGMTGPMKIVVKSANPAPDKATGQQKVGKKVHEGLLAWYVACSEPADIGSNITVYSATAPTVGETHEGAWVEGNEWPTGSGTIYLTMYTAADKAKKDGGGGQRQQGQTRDYTIENRQRAADAAVAYSAGKNWDLHTTLNCADAFVAYYKSGEKPAPKSKETPQG